MEQLNGKIEEQMPNSFYSEGDFSVEVEEHIQRHIQWCKERIKIESDPAWLNIWKTALEHSNDEEYMIWMYIHEFTRLMPDGIDRLDTSKSGLFRDLDDIIKKHYDYDKYIILKRRRSVLIRLKRMNKISASEEEELIQIEQKLNNYDLKLLYIEMRKLGYTQSDLGTARKKL